MSQILKSLIVDDEPLAHKIILEYAKDVSFVEIVSQCYLATEALSIIKSKSIDLIFLDINMPKLSGLDFLRTLQNPPLVIITSAYEEYALESYDLAVCDYLLKPFRFDRFVKATNKAYHQYQLIHNDSPKVTSKNQEEENEFNIVIKSDRKYLNISMLDIYYLESYGNYVKVWIGDDFHLTAKTLHSYLEVLPSIYFFKTHKSFIINRTFVNYIEGNTIAMKNGKKLPIGKTQKTAFKSFFTNNS